MPASLGFAPRGGPKSKCCGDAPLSFFRPPPSPTKKLPSGILRAHAAGRVDGAFSCCFKELMRLFFTTGDKSLLRHGVTIHTEGGVLMVWASLAFTLCDEAALKAMWCSKGASGLKCCPKCQNVTGVRAELAGMPGSSLVDIAETNPARCRLHTDRTIWAIADRLANPALGVAEREAMEIRLGYLHVPRGVLLDVDVRSVGGPARRIMFDFMHCVLSNGVLDEEIGLFFAHCRRELRLNAGDISTYLACWRWPRSVTNRPTVYEQDEFGIRGGASAVLNFYPVFREFVRKSVPRGSG